MREFRIGQGFDVHRYDASRPLMLCGVELDGEPGLAGHSDADVALHAITDAVFGAVSAGDIGTHFPPSDPHFKDAASAQFLSSALELAGNAGWSVVNCDLTLLGERPRIAPVREHLQAALAELLGVDVARVSVKATTTEGLGFTGRGEGLAAMAVVLLARESST